MAVTVRYYAGARAAAGVDSDTVSAATVGELVAELGARGERLSRVLAVCSLLVDGQATSDPQATLRDGAMVDVLPPFAGG